MSIQRYENVYGQIREDRDGQFVKREEVERYERALEWVANRDDGVFKNNSGGYSVWAITDLVDASTPLDAIEFAMEEGE